MKTLIPKYQNAWSNGQGQFEFRNSEPETSKPSTTKVSKKTKSLKDLPAIQTRTLTDADIRNKALQISEERKTGKTLVDKNGKIQPNCLATVMDTYSQAYPYYKGTGFNYTGNITFEEEGGGPFFRVIPYDSIQPGDIAVVNRRFGDGVKNSLASFKRWPHDIKEGHRLQFSSPTHAMIYAGRDSVGRPLFNYARGITGEGQDFYESEDNYRVKYPWEWDEETYPNAEDAQKKARENLTIYRFDDPTLRDK